ncbi:apolipoprotein N-acyltransferase [Aeoliella sp. ICT_H6.2]|uniref:Apolipoprotein N-acyltransferase n=1 Tax=Aeoliella straminimaris TaxID=2954799 RepID=A0A9X2FF25_9BACT|nr:apolipoprotein N-acyltransferase [Aeoliella straminimaris]MCO6047043.1 apolipoprotein N-acyltransferase [Aeoliella straminimaris]
MSTSPEQPDDASRFLSRLLPLILAALGSLLLVLAQPPLHWSILAWVAPLPWLYLIRLPQLPGRRPYLQIWLAGILYWLLAIHWIRLAHPATGIGLLFLAGYLGVYLPLFVAAVRVSVHRLRVPVWVAAPVVWTAVEWLQAHLLGGFLMAALGHTQIEESRLIQIADLAGAYLVSTLIMLVAACASEVIFADRQSRKPGWSPIAATLIAAAAVGGAWWYGGAKLAEFTTADDAPTKRIALVQGNERAVWTPDPDREKRVMDHYTRLSQEALDIAQESGEPFDLMVWPEGAFRTLLYSYDPEISAEQDTTEADKYASYGPTDLQRFVEVVDVPVMVGIDRYHLTHTSPMKPGNGRVYNAAVAVDREGQIIGTYDKNHLVMFGEYVPGGILWPGIYQYFPIGGVTPGTEPKAFEIDNVAYMPTICYETVIPHVVRRQVLQLTEAGQRPDVLVNLTNDSWFYDSSELRMHLACSRLRAIECRTPLVAAANGGLSANVDACGRLLAVSQPMNPEVLMVDVVPGGHDTLYLRAGDTFAIACLVVTLVAVAAGRWVGPQPPSSDTN